MIEIIKEEYRQTIQLTLPEGYVVDGDEPEIKINSFTGTINIAIKKVTNINLDVADPYGR